MAFSVSVLGKVDGAGSLGTAISPEWKSALHATGAAHSISVSCNRWLEVEVRAALLGEGCLQLAQQSA